MELYHNILAVEAGWLFEKNILTKPTYDKLSRRGSIDVLRRGCQNTPALVAWDSIPDRFKRAVKVELGDKNPYDAVKSSLIESCVEHSAAVSDFFDTYALSDGRNLPKEKRKEYYANAIILDAVGKLLENKRMKRASMGKKLKINWREIAEGVEELDRSKYPHNLPASDRRLEAKYRRYRKEGYASLIHSNFLNTNSAKIRGEVKESFIGELIADPRNLDNAQIEKLYNLMAAEMGWKTVTASTVAVWRDRLDLVTYAGRRGSTALSNVKSMQVKRRKPSFPLYYWTMDGWDVELLYQATSGGTTTYHNRPTVVVVLDACLKYPVGYAVGTHETPELIQQALRNAAQHTAELFGKMYRTQQLQSDRYSLKKLTPYYAGMADKVTPARAKNAKSKIVEPYFGSINKWYCQLLPNWSGFGITSDREKQPNVEFLNRYKSAFPDFAGVCRQVEMIMERERTSDGKQERLLQLWAQMPEEHKIELSYENYLLLFGETTGNRNRLEGNGLNITVRGMKRHYDCFDLTFREHASTDWEIRYDPADLSKVLAVNGDESRRYMLEEKYVQPMALRERGEGDSEQLQRVREYNRALEQKIIDYRAGNATILQNAALELPEFRDTLEKLLITDSAGQHKDNRNRERMLRQAEELKAKAEAEAKEEEKTDFRAERMNYIRGKVDLSQFVD
ncbi:MAG: hypothetical protein LBE91_20775 [Tannerella sp.]|jgi:hypothetical protein|nr:hypothetical protein [Tannerella sp.]